MWSHRPMMMAQ